MTYYIANHNPETNVFEIHVNEDGRPFRLHNEKEAFQLYADMCLEYGRKNILLLQYIPVTVNATCWNKMKIKKNVIK